MTSGEYYAAVKRNRLQLQAPAGNTLTRAASNRKGNRRSTHPARFHLYEVQHQANPNNALVDFCNIGKKCKDYKVKFGIIATSLEE